MPVLNLVTTGNNYNDTTPPCTLVPVPYVEQITFGENGTGDFYAQFYYPDPNNAGKFILDPDEHWFPKTTSGAYATGVAGAQFRSASTNVPATITADQSLSNTPTIYPGAPTASIVATTGLIKIWDSSEAGISLPAASFTTSTIPQTYKHLLIVGSLHSNYSTGYFDTARLRVNLDSGSVYDTQFWLIDNTSLTASRSVNSFHELGQIPTDNFGTNSYSGFVCEIPDYTSIHQKTIMSRMIGADSGANISKTEQTTLYETTGVGISSITFFTVDGQFTTGIDVTLYGYA